MTRQQRDEMIWLYAAGSLEQSEIEAVRQLLAQNDPEDLRVWKEAQEVVGRLPEALEPMYPPLIVRTRLADRLRESDSSRGITSRDISTKFPERMLIPDPIDAFRRPKPLWQRARWPIAALLLLGALLASIYSNNQISATERKARARTLVLETQLRNLQLERDALESERDTLTNNLLTAKTDLNDAVAKLKREVDVLRSSNLEMISLSSEQTKAWGRVMWDHENRQWHVTVFDLAPPAAGREYELWFITPDQKKIAGPTFMVNAKGEASLMAKIPEGVTEIALAAITDEPIGGVAQPTGSIHLVGKPVVK